MVQSVNPRAIVTFATTVLRRPSLLIPHISVDNVNQIDFDDLKKNGGITCVVFDKDNTLTAPYGIELHPDATKGVEMAKQVFGPDKVAILSNSAGTYNDDPNFKDAQLIEQSLDIPVIRHRDKKPGGHDEVLQHFGLDQTKAVADVLTDNNSNNDDDDHQTDLSNTSLSSYSQVCIVGDRLLTDVVFGNLVGMLTVHTLPLCKGKDNQRDNLPAKIFRGIENFLLYGNPIGRFLLKSWKPKHRHWKPATER